MWRNIGSARHCLARYNPSDRTSFGVASGHLGDRQHALAGGFLEGIDSFDPEYFGFDSAEAPAVNPQLRTLLELSVDALSDSGLQVKAPRQRTGVFLCCGNNEYEELCLQRNGKDLQLSPHRIELLNKPDYIASQVADRLGLNGPAISVMSACSSSLAAIHLATQALRAGEADICLAGGVSIRSLIPHVHLAIAEATHSPSESCQPSGDDADGTLVADGGGVVALMTLDDAVKGGHRVYATLIGSAVNSDEHETPEFAMPNAATQARVYAAALKQAGVAADSVGYIETHEAGTLALWGDRIEIHALQEVYGAAGTATIALGALKSNVGHLDAGAGVAGFIKAVLSLYYKQIPPTVSPANPTGKVDWDRTPFHLPSAISDWKDVPGRPRRAAVSALGIGGTYAHVILEEAPPSSTHHIPQYGVWPIPVSAHSPAALQHAETDIGRFVAAQTMNPDAVCRAMCETRPAYPHRSFALLRTDTAPPVFEIKPPQLDTTGADLDAPSHIFLFPGQGTQVAGMGAALYSRFALFANRVEEALAVLEPARAEMIRRAFFIKNAEPATLLDSNRTDVVQPGLLAFEVALADLLRAFGIKPAAMIGHSLGEISCAAVSGGLTLADAMRIASIRGSQSEKAPAGAMLVVAASLEEAASFIAGLDCDLAADNALQQFVLSGTLEVITEAEKRLDAEGFFVRLFNTRYGFHSAQLDSILAGFGAATKDIPRRRMEIPYVSTLTGSWITEREFTSAGYLPDQLRNTVRFREGIAVLHETFPNAVFWELGPGSVLSTFARTQRPQSARYLTPVGIVKEDFEISNLLSALGQAWMAGASIDWSTPLELARHPISPLPAPPMMRRSLWVGMPDVQRPPTGHDHDSEQAHTTEREKIEGAGAR